MMMHRHGGPRGMGPGFGGPRGFGPPPPPPPHWGHHGWGRPPYYGGGCLGCCIPFLIGLFGIISFVVMLISAIV